MSEESKIEIYRDPLPLVVIGGKTVALRYIHIVVCCLLFEKFSGVSPSPSLLVPLSPCPLVPLSPLSPRLYLERYTFECNLV